MNHYLKQENKKILKLRKEEEERRKKENWKICQKKDTKKPTKNEGNYSF